MIRMVTIIAGGRDYQLTADDYARLDKLPISEVVSGCAPGADTCGEKWAYAKGLKIHKFPADWRAFGNAAGSIRNREMAQFANSVVLFPGGKGTDDMFNCARRASLEIFDYRGKLGSASQLTLNLT